MSGKSDRLCSPIIQEQQSLISESPGWQACGSPSPVLTVSGHSFSKMLRLKLEMKTLENIWQQQYSLEVLPADPNRKWAKTSSLLGHRMPHGFGAWRLQGLCIHVYQKENSIFFQEIGVGLPSPRGPQQLTHLLQTWCLEFHSPHL